MGSLLTLLLVITLGLWLGGFLFLGRLHPCGAADASGSPRSLSVIIPARDEEQNLPRLLRSLLSQPDPPDEIIVVDDGSSDRTAEVAEKLGATVMSPGVPPEGWRGKTWACQQGAKAAKGDLLLFVDADTWFEPNGLARLLAGYEGGAFSVGPYHALREPYENLSLFFNFTMVVSTVPGGLFGQSLLVDRDSYERVGGHETVKARILEHCRLAGEFRAVGIPVRSVPGRGTFSVRMYPEGLGQLVEGWTKGFASGAGQTPPLTLVRVVLWMIGLMTAPLGLLMTGDWMCWGGTCLLCAVQVGWFGRKLGAFHWAASLLYPLPLLFFFGVFAWSALRSGKQVSWKGRNIRAD